MSSFLHTKFLVTTVSHKNWFHFGKRPPLGQRVITSRTVMITLLSTLRVPAICHYVWVQRSQCCQLYLYFVLSNIFFNWASNAKFTNLANWISFTKLRKLLIDKISISWQHWLREGEYITLKMCLFHFQLNKHNFFHVRS